MHTSAATPVVTRFRPDQDTTDADQKEQRRKDAKGNGKFADALDTADIAAPSSPLKHKEGVAVVGGGPAGMATALMLAQRGWTDITVIERLPMVTHMDPQR
jgi:NADPH-dependent 2,4-dienoyl-CoA reductase/sulfur reductase-like enzyme